jgi:hypothetical protein
MKFYDFLILENDQFKQKFDSRRYRMIESFAETSINKSDIITFMGNNLNSDFSETDLQELKNLVISLNDVKDLLNGKTLQDYKTKDELKRDLDTLKTNIFNLNIDGKFIKVYEEENYVLIYPENFRSYYMLNNYIPTLYNNTNTEVNYLREKTYGVTLFLLPKNGYSGFYRIKYSFDGTITVLNNLGEPESKYSLGSTILKACKDFVDTKFKKYIELFEDPYLKQQYIRLNNEMIDKKENQGQDVLRSKDAWFGKEIGRRAVVALNYAKEYESEFDDEYELNDIYDLYDYGSGDFSTLPNGGGLTFRVLNEEEAERDAEEYWETYVNDNELLDLFDKSTISRFIDEDRTKQMFWEFHHDLIRDEPKAYFDEDELPISSYDQRKIDNLKNEQDSLQDEIDNLDMSDEDIEKHRERIEEIDSEIVDIETEADREPTDDQIDEKIDDLWYNEKSDLYDWIELQGLDLADFIDKEELVKTLLNENGYDSVFSSYDGSYDSQYVEGKLYYVYRME